MKTNFNKGLGLVGLSGGASDEHCVATGGREVVWELILEAFGATNGQRDVEAEAAFDNGEPAGCVTIEVEAAEVPVEGRPY